MSTESSYVTDDEARSRVTAELSRLLADSYTLYLKTHNFHWNVVGPHFTSLHTLFETHYTELALAVDEIAERIRALGKRAPGSYAEFGALTGVREAVADDLPAMRMVEALAGDNETVAKTAAAVFAVADAAGDQPTCDLAVRRQQIHEKSAWMLRALAR